MKHEIQIPHSAKELIQMLQDNSYEAYVVGGCVRDSLLQRSANDWDICTSATPEQMLFVFSSKRVIQTGLKHGTATVINGENQYEITTFRIDGSYSDNRRPDSVYFTANIKQDLLRRDFTINAMAYNEKDGLIDPYGGMQDLKNKLIKCVGNPQKRFEEDALRILRAIRFSCQLDFDIDEQTARQIHLQCQSLKNISAERIQSELCKMIVCPSFFKKLDVFKDVFAVFLPDLEKCFDFSQNTPYHIYDIFMHTVHALKHCPSYDLTTRLALLFHDIGKSRVYSEDENNTGHFYGHAKQSRIIADRLMSELKFDNATRNDVVELVGFHDAHIENSKRSVKKWLSRLGEVQLRRLLCIMEADNRAKNPIYITERVERLKEISDLLDVIISENECFSLKDLAVSGKDLLKIGYKQDKKLGETLKLLLDDVISEKLTNTKEELIEQAKRLL